MDNTSNINSRDTYLSKFRSRFQYISALILICAVVLLGFGFKFVLSSQMVSDAAHYNAEIAKWYSSNINSRTSLRSFDPVAIISPSVLNIRIFNLDGGLIYSSDQSKGKKFKSASTEFSAYQLKDYKTKLGVLKAIVSHLPIYANDTNRLIASIEISRNVEVETRNISDRLESIIFYLCFLAIILHVAYSLYISRLYHSLGDYESESRSSIRKSEYLSAHDSLTGLLNRGMFVDRLIHAGMKADRQNEMLAVIIVDIDRFKLINDSLGYHAGDQVVRMVAERLRTEVRESDTIARVGGDEFLILIDAMEDHQEAARVVSRIQKCLQDSFNYRDREVMLTASIGIAVYPKDGGNVEEIINHADTAKDKAKHNGGNEFRFYTGDMNVSSWKRLEMEGDLRRALDRDEYIIYYQPKVDLLQGKITGMESLLRWKRSNGDLVSPDEFIPLLEQTGLIVPVGEWVLRESCKAARRWMDNGFGPMVIAVNVSARQFRQLDFVDTVKNILIETNLAPELLEIEVTEGILMEDTVGSAATIEALKAHGIRIAIDDFGTGYSSLSYLQRYRVDTLKIDKAFVQDIEGNSEGAAIVTTVISLAHNLRLHIVAEGVETHDQLAFLMALGCQQIQGYLFSRPLPEKDFTELLKNGAVVFRDIMIQQKNIA